MDNAESSRSVDYDPFSPDPFGSYSLLREKCPVHHYPHFGEDGFYTVSRYPDVLDLFRDVDRWSGVWGQGPQHVREGGLRSDPPEHTIFRRLVTSAFTPARTAAMAPLVEEVATDLAQGLAPTGAADLVRDFATLMPVRIIAVILGVPAQHRSTFRTLSDRFMDAQNSSDPAELQQAKDAIYEIFRDEMALRRRLLDRGAPVVRGIEASGDAVPDDLLTNLLVAQRDGRLFTEDELLPLLLLLLVGGNETTTTLIANLTYRLLERNIFEQVAGDPALLDRAIEESLRFDPPVLGLFRTARGDQEIAGTRIPDGAKVDGLYAAANRDSSVFSDPDAFRLDRTRAEAAKHLSFGAGIWVCPGSGLARMEARMAVGAVARYMPGLRLAGEPELSAKLVTWGVRSLPVSWAHVK